jgi:hypothetical protein
LNETFQVDKSKPDTLTVRVIAGKPGVRDMIANRLTQSVGMPVTVLLVDDIALERPGKARWVRA